MGHQSLAPTTRGTTTTINGPTQAYGRQVTDRLPTVVVIDDAPDVRALVRTRLRLSRRLEVVDEGSTGHDAVRLALEHRPDLMLLDVSMPELDGLQALPDIVRASPGTRVVLFSGFDERGLAERGLELGAAAFIEKSGSVDRLVADLLAVLRTGRRRGDDGAGDTEVVVEEGTVDDSTVDDSADGDSADDRVLADHRERFREVFEQAAIGMATLTLSGQVVRANGALADLLQQPAGGLVGVGYASLADDEGAAQVTTAVAALTDGAADVVHVTHELAERATVRSTLAVVRGEHGQPLYLFVQAQDVTAQRRVDEQLRASEARLQLLVEAVEDYAIFMLDPTGRVASWNTGAERIKGYRGEEIIGRHFRLFYPEQAQRAQHPERELELALRDGRYEEEGWRVRRDGTRFWANVVLTAVRDADGRHVGFAKVTRDHTQRRDTQVEREQAAAEVARANGELAVANQLLARAAADQAQFLAVTAHELRGPVTVLAGSADLIAAHWDEVTVAERTEILQGMTSSARRLRRLIGELLTASRLEAGAVQLDLRRTRLVDVLRAGTTGAREHPGDTVVVQCAPDLQVVADPDRLAQVVENLVRNALTHGSAPVTVTATRDGDRVLVGVHDEGPGVPAAVAPRLFERFITGERRSGTGLGLFIVRELARAHGGDAWYDAADRTFVVALRAGTDA